METDSCMISTKFNPIDGSTCKVLAEHLLFLQGDSSLVSMDARKLKSDLYVKPAYALLGKIFNLRWKTCNVLKDLTKEMNWLFFQIFLTYFWKCLIFINFVLLIKFLFLMKLKIKLNLKYLLKELKSPFFYTTATPLANCTNKQQLTVLTTPPITKIIKSDCPSHDSIPT